MRDHNVLIDTLSQEMRPVVRVAPAWRRALGWAPLALGLGYLATRMLHRFDTDWASDHAMVSAANAGLSLALGVAVFMAALSTGIAGAAIRAKGWMIAGVLAWLALAMGSIALSAKPLGVERGVGSYCFTFVIAAGIPMIGVALAALRQTRSLTPKRSLAMAGAGIAFLCFGLLAFCHPAAMSVADFIAHLAAALVLGGITVLVGRPVIRV